MAAGPLRSFLLRLPGFERACRRLTRDHARVLMYHRFTDDATADPEATPLQFFARQLDLVQAHCEVAGPGAVVAREEGDRPAGRRPQVMVTVDDGYADFHRHAFPLLRERGLPAVLFVTTRFVDGRSWMWWDKISHVLEKARTEVAEVRLAGQTLGGSLRTHADRRAFWSQVVPALRFVSDERKESVVVDLADQLGVELPQSCPPDYAPSTWNEIRAMADGGIAMGAHTLTHPILSRVDKTRAHAEICGSRDELAAQLGRPVPWFAYPQGGPADFNGDTLDIVKEAGFTRTWVAYSDPDLGDDARRRPRYFVSSDPEDFRWTICGAEHLVLRLRSMLGLRTDVSTGYWTGSELAAALNAVEGTGSET